jgi:hypothetical protein
VKVTEVQTEIQRAAGALHLLPERFRQLPDSEAEQVYWSALRRFVTSTFEPRGWWEHLRDPQVSLRPVAGSRGYLLIPEFVPDPDAIVYFVAEDVEAPFFPAYLTTARTAADIIGECFGYEYYFIPPDLSWLIGENHHDVIFGSGELIVQRINARLNATRN